MQTKCSRKKEYFKSCGWLFLALLPTLFFLKGFGAENVALIPENSCVVVEKGRSVVEAKGGYFFFSDAKMRKVYDRGGGDFQISGSFRIWKSLQIYGSVEYLSRHGRSLGGHQKTRIWEIPLSLGLKPVIPISEKIQYYFALGPRYCFIHQHNQSAFVDRTLNQNGFGGFANTGFNFFPYRHLSVDLFAEYSYVRLHFHPSKANVVGRRMQVGGFTFGGGLGYAF